MMFMNIAKIMLFCVALAFAENSLRGFAYNLYETPGAAPTIADILQKPSDIYGHNFIYVSPASGSGYSAFDLVGGSALLGFDQSLMLGYAKNFYGLLLRISPHQFCYRKNEDNYECLSNENKNYIGLNFSVPLGNSILYAYTSRTTTDKYNDDNDEDIIIYKDESSFKELYVGITGGNMLIWDFKFGFDRRKTSFSGYGYEKYDFIPYEFNDAYYLTDAKLIFNFGYKIMQNDRLKFIVGSNNGLYCKYSSYSYYDFGMYNLQAIISPNFLGEAVLTEHLLIFAGARYSVFSEMFLFTEGYYHNKEIETFGIANFGSEAYLGLRYERKNWAVETRLQSDAFGEILSGNNPFASLGVFFFFQP